MTEHAKTLDQWITDMTALIKKNADPEPEYFVSFLNYPSSVQELVRLIDAMEDRLAEEGEAYYSACIFALDICVAQLQSAHETGHKLAGKIMNQLMDELEHAINAGNHSLSFWLPILNAFYDVHVELSPGLRDAYLELAGQDEEYTYEEVDHLAAIREMISELSDLSVFDIAENFFAQSHAMPASFFADLLIDLYSIEEGQDIALLALLHPKPEVRDIVVATLEQLMDTIVLSSLSLTRLQSIKNWYPPEYHDQINRWIKVQRRKGVLFNKVASVPVIQIKASEIDGGGAEGLFIHIREGRKNRLCGLLVKQHLGIKDVWVTAPMSNAGIKKCYRDAFDDNVTLREVDLPYLTRVVEHFLATAIVTGHMPDLHLLEVQEFLGLHFIPHFLDIPALMDQLSIEIMPYTPETVQTSFRKSKSWLRNKVFADSWYIENANIDKLVNHCSHFVDGVKLCRIEEAVEAVFDQEMENQRDHWLFHFIWVTLWLKSGARKNEKVWQDSFVIAYAIYNGEELRNIPILQEIVQQTVFNSIETMTERRTHLNRE